MNAFAPRLGHGNQLGPLVHPQLVEDVLQVLLHRIHGARQVLRDGEVVPAPHHARGTSISRGVSLCFCSHSGGTYDISCSSSAQTHLRVLISSGMKLTFSFSLKRGQG